MSILRECQNCGKEFSIYYYEEGKKKHSDKRKFCYECSPIGQHNTKRSLKSLNEKVCKHCNITKPIDEFYKKFTICKKCHIDNTKVRQHELKKQCVDYLGGCCKICGYEKCLGALEFHHLVQDEKEFSLSEMRTYNFDNIKNELDKCVLLCARCHREVHCGYARIV